MFGTEAAGNSRSQCDENVTGTILLVLIDSLRARAHPEILHGLIPAVIGGAILTSLFRHFKVRPMPKPRLIVPLSSDGILPDLAIYHTTSRVVHRQFLFQDEEPSGAS